MFADQFKRSFGLVAIECRPGREGGGRTDKRRQRSLIENASNRFGDFVVVPYFIFSLGSNPFRIILERRLFAGGIRRIRNCGPVITRIELPLCNGNETGGACSFCRSDGLSACKG